MNMLTTTDWEDILVEQVSFALGRNFVLSFQRTERTSFDRCVSGCAAAKGGFVKTGPSSCSMRWSTSALINTLPSWRYSAKRLSCCKSG